MDIEARVAQLEQRRELARRRLGLRDPRCDVCSEDEVLALSSKGDGFICYACDAGQRGRDETEGHHVAGRAIDPDFVVPIPANEHRVLSELQRAWLPAATRNRNESPLLRWAATDNGWHDVLHLTLEQLQPQPDFLLALDQWITLQLGPRWWDLFNQWRIEYDEHHDP